MGRTTVLALLYYVGPAMLGRDAFEDLALASFQRAMKEKTLKQALQDLVNAEARKTTGRSPEALDPWRYMRTRTA